MQKISEAIVAGSLDFISQDELSRAERVKLELGAGAQIVAPYKPNRKQRRAQEKARKLQAKFLEKEKK